MPHLALSGSGGEGAYVFIQRGEGPFSGLLVEIEQLFRIVVRYLFKRCVKIVLKFYDAVEFFADPEAGIFFRKLIERGLDLLGTIVLDLA